MTKNGKVILGGTFDILHRGHEALIAKAAAEGDLIILGLTSDEMATRSRDHDINKLDARRAMLDRYFSDQMFGGKVVVITDEFGRTAEGAGAIEDKGPFNGIVVSPGSRRNAEKINEMRKAKGWPPIKIFEVPYVLAEDGRPISSTRIRNGEIDRDGNILKKK